MGVVYLIHFEHGLHVTGNRYAQHYIGFTTDWWTFWSRMAHHRAGSGARLMRAVGEAGIDWYVARTWEQADRTFERYLKNKRHHRLMCPVCAIEREDQHGFISVFPGERQLFTRHEREDIRMGIKWYRNRLNHVSQLETAFSLTT